MPSNQTLSVQEVHQRALGELLAQGFSELQADAIAATVTAAERDGCLSHGLFRIPFYIGALKNEKVDAHAVPEVIDRPWLSRSQLPTRSSRPLVVPSHYLARTQWPLPGRARTMDRWFLTKRPVSAHAVKSN